jgi:thiamine-monophosphate kinase
MDIFENKNNRTELSELGEFGLIDHLTKNIKLHHEQTLKGVGDDAAVIENNADEVTLVTTDMLVEGVHFDLTYMPLKHLGYKAIVVNLSDICAMNGKPKQVFVSMALSNRFSLEAVEELYTGMLLACQQYKVDLVGGDTTSSTAGLVLSITATGTATKGNQVYRDGAKPNDLVCVSGDLGSAYLGLQILEREKQIYIENPGVQPDLEGFDYILERQLKPEARVDIIDLLAEMGVKPTSMIDVSDGLSSELLHICKQSGVGCTIYEDKLPIDPVAYDTARELNLDPTTCMLNGGEDYELLFTISIDDFDKIKHNPSITIIGHITPKDEGANLVPANGPMIPLQAQGWNALS